ncbi:hypothetical protein GIB67_015082 [Kingdonia uniflora]|uniref:Vacuolar fusion protein MON1 homolog n=1 Tax=Kingdonia uniflora TaxID=39325 RepID=A0A7J7NMX6_9MAGN|nr:hypothetical protein GIB67_015082 [Kingdonia uniflora]
MESDSNSSIDLNPDSLNTNSPPDNFKFWSLNESNNVKDSEHVSNHEVSAGLANGSLYDNLDQIEEPQIEKPVPCDSMIVAEAFEVVDEVGKSCSSPSSAGYVGERGSSEVVNGSLYTNLDQIEEPQTELSVPSDPIPVAEAFDGVSEVGQSSFVQRENSELEFDAHSSPSSSGYVGERGVGVASIRMRSLLYALAFSFSCRNGLKVLCLIGEGSCGPSSTSEIEEVVDSDADGDVIPQENTINDFSDSASWVPGKRHIDEDDASISWRKRKKHFFVLSHSGKPIYSRYGDEHKLAGFSATLQAIISFVENGEDRVKFVRAGKHLVVFLVKGPIYLVCISCTEESHEALTGQLELLYGQLMSALVQGGEDLYEEKAYGDILEFLDYLFSSIPVLIERLGRTRPDPNREDRMTWIYNNTLGSNVDKDKEKVGKMLDDEKRELSQGLKTECSGEAGINSLEKEIKYTSADESSDGLNSLSHVLDSSGDVNEMLLILTKSVNRCFEKNPKFDMTPLLGGTDAVFSSLIHSFSWNPSTFLHAYTCLPLAYPTRQAAGSILQDVADSGVLFAILMCKHKVVSLVGAQKASLHPDDMLLLANFVLSSESFRQGEIWFKEEEEEEKEEAKGGGDDDNDDKVEEENLRVSKTSESFSPICLPRYNPMAFLYAYVHYLDVDTYLMLLTTSSDAFYHLKDCRIRIEMVLLKSNVLSEVQRSILEGGLHVEDLPIDPSPRTVSLSPHLGQEKITTESSERTRESSFGIGGPAGLWHFIYRSINLDQYVASEFSSPINSSNQQKRLYRAYQKLYASMHDKGTAPHKTQFRRDENYALLCWITQDFELYAAFDPLADKALAIKTCNRVCQWVRDVENEIFLLGSSPFSW